MQSIHPVLPTHNIIILANTTQITIFWDCLLPFSFSKSSFHLTFSHSYLFHVVVILIMGLYAWGVFPWPPSEISLQGSSGRLQAKSLLSPMISLQNLLTCPSTRTFSDSALISASSATARSVTMALPTDHPQ